MTFVQDKLNIHCLYCFIPSISLRDIPFVLKGYLFYVDLIKNRKTTCCVVIQQSTGICIQKDTPDVYTSVTTSFRNQKGVRLFHSTLSSIFAF